MVHGSAVLHLNLIGLLFYLGSLGCRSEVTVTKDSVVALTCDPS